MIQYIQSFIGPTIYKTVAYLNTSGSYDSLPITQVRSQYLTQCERARSLVLESPYWLRDRRAVMGGARVRPCGSTCITVAQYLSIDIIDKYWHRDAREVILMDVRKVWKMILDYYSVCCYYAV